MFSDYTLVFDETVGDYVIVKGLSYLPEAEQYGSGYDTAQKVNRMQALQQSCYFICKCFQEGQELLVGLVTGCCVNKNVIILPTNTNIGNGIANIRNPYH